MLAALQANEVLSAGLKDPKCLKAIQLVMSLSANEKANAFKEVADPILMDPSVAAFMNEFSKLMATHFEKLGEQSQTQTSPTSIVSQPVVAEIGPLHAQAIKKKSSSSIEMNRNDITEGKEKSSTTNVDDDKVQQVILFDFWHCSPAYD